MFGESRPVPSHYTFLLLPRAPCDIASGLPPSCEPVSREGPPQCVGTPHEGGLIHGDHGAGAHAAHWRESEGRALGDTAVPTEGPEAPSHGPVVGGF